MWRFVLEHKVLIGVSVLVVLGGSVYTSITLHKDPLSGIATSTAETGTVQSIVSISGLTKSRDTAELAFPVSGIVASIPVREGDTVAAGTLLATLASNGQVANLKKAEAGVAIAKNNLATLLAGTRNEAREVTTAAVASAEAEVHRITTSQKILVDNARHALYSNHLVARSSRTDEDAPAPTITGTYQCDQAGTYTIELYDSAAASGYSFNLSGLETGTYPISTNQANPLGTCGLYVQISPYTSYSNTTWTIEVPNPSDSSYVALKNALMLAEQTASSAIASANEALTLAKRKQSLENANATPENIAAATANVAAAEATLAEVTAALADRSIIAPFTGIVTSVSILAGETAPLTPVITLLSTSTYEAVARVPEIDITKVALGQEAHLVFDAARTEPQTGHVSYIAALPTVIDGVSYFDVKITLDTIPAWLRGGLNADIDIITDSRTNVTKVPSRYIFTNGSSTSIRTLFGNTLATTTVTVSFRGNDGYVAVTGIEPGTVIVAP